MMTNTVNCMTLANGIADGDKLALDAARGTILRSNSATIVRAQLSGHNMSLLSMMQSTSVPGISSAALTGNGVR